MAAAKLDFIIEQGSTFQRKLIFKDSEGVLVDLSGLTLRGQIRQNPSSPTITASFTCVIDPDQITNKGQASISLTAIETAAMVLPEQKFASRKTVAFAYDIEKVGGSVVTRILEGVVNVSPEVTK